MRSEPFMFLLVLYVTSSWASKTWPNKRQSLVVGELYLAGFFPIHDKDTQSVCGRIEEEGIQQLETFLFTINEINQNSTILPNITLGALGLDSCDSTPFTLEVAMDCTRDFLAANKGFRKKLKCERNMNSTNNGPLTKLIGVIGGKSSHVSIQLANLLRVFNISQVSYKSSAPSLSNKKKYEYFFRTVPPLFHQVKALLEIVKAFNWTYISVVYSDSVYGNAGFENLHLFAAKENICFATQQRVTVEAFTDSDYDAVLDALIKEKNASGVVLFGEKLLAKNVMAASHRKGAKDKFVWLGSEAWATRDYAVKDFNEVAEGTLSVAYVIKPPPGLLEYYRSVTPESKSNPFFYEFWESKKNCRLEDYNNTRPETPYNKNFTEACNGTIPDDLYMQEMPSAHLVRNAVYSIATALHNMHQKKCHGKPGLCKEIDTIDGEEIKKYLKEVKFYDYNGHLFQFDENGDAHPQYNIVNYQKKRDGSGEYYWRLVGNYTKSGNSTWTVELNRTIMRFKHQMPEFPESICSAPCLAGQIKVQLDSDKCCWTCLNCTEFQFVSEKHVCEDCDEGSIPHEGRNNCTELQEMFMDYQNPWAKGCIAFAVIGILAAVVVIVVFWKYWHTPIIKASARELSVMLLLGIFLSYLLTFAIVYRPSTWNCAAVRFLLGLCYTISYAVIVIKTRRISRIFEWRGRRQKPKYTSPQSQIMLVSALVAVEVVINATWLMYDLPCTVHVFPSRLENILVCRGSDDVSYLFGLLYPFLLMIVCTVYAFKTRKCPDGFNEARYITFTNYTTCVIWLAFLPIFITHKNPYVRTATLSLLLSSSATVQILCLFVPKAYVAILHPENNTKDIVMGYTGGTSSSATLSD